jgi:hypothetical protein
LRLERRCSRVIFSLSSANAVAPFVRNFALPSSVCAAASLFVAIVPLPQNSARAERTPFARSRAALFKRLPLER